MGTVQAIPTADVPAAQNLYWMVARYLARTFNVPLPRMPLPDTHPAPISNHPVRCRRPVPLLLIAVSVTLLLNGCSLRVSYPYLDWWVNWKVRDYISLDRQQQQHLNSTLDQFQRWHQHTQLPAYASELEALQARLQQPGLTPALLKSYGKQSEQYWLASLDYVLPEVTAMFMTVSDTQWQQFTQAVLAKTDKDTRPYLEGSRDQQLRLRQRQLAKGAKSWLGGLSPEQRQLIQQWSAEMHNLAIIRRLEQQRWVEQADQLYRLRQTLTTADVQAQLRRLMAEENSFWLPEHLSLLEENRHRTLQLLCDLHASMSEAQRARLLQRLTDMHQDLLYLYHKTLRDRG